MNRFLIVVVVFVALLSGCVTKQEPPKHVDVPIFHPPRPQPVVVEPPEWSLVTPTTRDSILVDGTQYSYMCMTWEDYLTMGQNMQVIIRGFKEYETLLCYYRKELNELQCVEEKSK